MSWARAFVKRIRETFAGKRQAPPLPRTSSPPRFRSADEGLNGLVDSAKNPTKAYTTDPGPREERRESKPAVSRDWHGKEEG